MDFFFAACIALLGYTGSGWGKVRVVLREVRNAKSREPVQYLYQLPDECCSFDSTLRQSLCYAVYCSTLAGT